MVPLALTLGTNPGTGSVPRSNTARCVGCAGCGARAARCVERREGPVAARLAARGAWAWRRLGCGAVISTAGSSVAPGLAVCADAADESQMLGAINALLSNSALIADLRPAFAPASMDFIIGPQLSRRTNRIRRRASTRLQSFCANQVWN
ncbi:hypothetical protein NML43_03205 [Rhodopseudomonas palustris]|uniref:hypothetical protein n=1 Tax=Rhodopseudomonas palustris TaxID=1076 RepID=UPI0020CC2A6C|nr:hypothetical protein [Rhodopseudomonas palustris]